MNHASKRFRALFASTLLAIAVLGQSTFSTTTPFTGGPRSRGVAFSVGKRVFMGMGTNSTTNVRQADIWEFNPTTGVWTQRANFPGTGREGAVAFSVGDAAYVGMGTETGGVRKKDLWRYVPATNTWTQRADIGGVARSNAVAFSIGTFGYVATGSGASGRLNDAWRYDPASNQWTQRANFPGAARTEACAFAINSFGYVGLGSTTGGLASDLYRFDPAGNAWAAMSALPAAGRRLSVAFAINNIGYVVGGNNPSLTAEVWAYDPGINSWSQTINAPQPVAEHMGCAISNQGFIATGFIGGGYTNATQRFSPVAPTPAANSWTRKADQPSTDQTYLSNEFTLGNKGYVQGGKDPNAPTNVSATMREFDPRTNAWSIRPAPTAGSFRAEAVGVGLLGKGHLIAGVSTASTFLSTHQQYDPATTSWTTRQAMPAARSGAVGFAINGAIYVGTGFVPFIGPTKDLWKYDPTTNTWTQMADLPGQERRLAVGFAIDGKGYVCTGVNPSETALNDLWAYDPGTNTWQARANYGGSARSEAAAFVIGGKGFVGTGVFGVGVLSDMWSYDPVTDTWTQRADVPGGGRRGAAGFAIGNKGYISGGRTAFQPAARDTWEYEPGPINCSANNLSVELFTDAQPNETTWEIAPQGDPTPVCSGSTTAPGSTVLFNCCVPNGCYDLRVFDSFGDGIAGGGVNLYDASGRTIIRNQSGGGFFTTVSVITNTDGTPWSFCLPLGPDELVPSSCNISASLNQVITLQVQENPTVTAQLGVGNNTDDGYQICIADANGGFRRNVFLSLASPGTAFPAGTPAATRPTFFNINFSNAPFLPVGRPLNVRVRSKVNNVFTACGPGCELLLTPPTQTTSTLTQTADPVVSCGATNVSVNSGVLYASLVPGANRYQFRFTGPNNYARNIAAPSAAINSLAARTLNMSTMTTNKPPCGVPVSVTVAVSFDGGTNYFPVGQACTVTFSGCTGQLRMAEGTLADASQPPRIWPNPCADGVLRADLGDLDPARTTLAIYDATGQLVLQRTLAGTERTTTIDLEGRLLPGAYLVVFDAGDRRHTERVVLM